ncbi:FKBP-type peptidyl-prolyl cis-trans isomerase [Altererythrobacter sp. CC-YST694]|uniref:FKBP-type peptidyl-prolyl cis-trans isomerase n=1 Tax=Altererythrobacter sp. CC-YST694 TaxID=2755038 RepID=UPI001D00BEA0|nr:FKBP-type peptidyl-prolyl cis-trans isomerase [Altererythrobacter sp. CC-YST694]MCB5426219.1 FKBP-type peptidyl-prolyl cis-trans isomerase [Altererythrobacter sp. CC-YST694]
MAEVTRVPLQPLKKGSLAKLWLGVIVVILLGAAFAWLTVPKGVSVTEITAGTGASPGKTDVVVVNYVGKLEDGTVFDQGQGVPIPLGQGTIPGFGEGLAKMKKGGKYTLQIPAEKAYGPKEQKNPMTGEVVIPANADLTFEIELIDYMSEADFQRRMQIQQMMQMQQQQGGAPGGAPSLPEGAPLPQ